MKRLDVHKIIVYEDNTTFILIVAMHWHYNQQLSTHYNLSLSSANKNLRKDICLMPW